MKLLAIEPQQYMHYYQGRYQRARDLRRTSCTCSTARAPTTSGRPSVTGWSAASTSTTSIAEARRWHAEEHFDGVITFSEFAVTGGRRGRRGARPARHRRAGGGAEPQQVPDAPGLRAGRRADPVLPLRRASCPTRWPPARSSATR